MKKYIVFDFDGTMARTMDILVRVLNDFADEIKVRKRPLKGLKSQL